MSHGGVSREGTDSGGTDSGYGAPSQSSAPRPDAATKETIRPPSPVNPGDRPPRAVRRPRNREAGLPDSRDIGPRGHGGIIFALDLRNAPTN